VGAGPLPRVGPADHPPRPPIPIVALDEAAMAAARERGESEAAVWVAGVAGAGRPARARAVRPEQGAAGAPAPTGGAAPTEAARAAPAASPDAAPALTVAEVAAAVDAGRDLAAATAADGIAVLVASASPDHDDAARGLLAALADEPARPLRALRTRGTHELAVLCGIALGAGERGLGCACDGLAALAGAAVAAAIEPPLGARLRALTDHEPAASLGIASADATELQSALD